MLYLLVSSSYWIHSHIQKLQVREDLILIYKNSSGVQDDFNELKIVPQGVIDGNPKYTKTVVICERPLV